MEGISDVAQVFKVYWALLLGNILEWYEFAIYSFLEPYLEINFFGGSAISTWLGFACTFAARPFGGIVLGLLGDLFGRKVSTFLSICGMIIGTVGQGPEGLVETMPTRTLKGISLFCLCRRLGAQLPKWQSGWDYWACAVGSAAAPSGRAPSR